MNTLKNFMLFWKKAFVFAILMLTIFNLKAQTVYYVADACELASTLASLSTMDCSSSPVTVQITNDIDLGELAPQDFPLILPPNVTLAGDYDFFDIPTGANQFSYGTRVFFPYLYDEGWWCRIPDVSNPDYYNFPYDVRGAAFIMHDMSSIQNICLVGPVKHTKDYRFDNRGHFNDMCNATLYPPHEGLSTGIQVWGNDCHISDCEIFGFNNFGIIVFDMIKFSLTPANCWNQNDGLCTIDRCYIYNNMGFGYGYGVWVSGGYGLGICDDAGLGNESCVNIANDPVDPRAAFIQNYDRPEELAYFNECIFLQNKHDIACSDNRNSLMINGCTFSRRSADHNIDRHRGSPFLCCNPTPFSFNGTQGVAADDVIECGGNLIAIQNSSFYRMFRNLDIPYPNINDCNSPFNPVPPGLQIQNSYFNTPNEAFDFLNGYTLTTTGTGSTPADPTTASSWYQLQNNCTTCVTERSGHGKFIIDRFDQYNWDIENDATLYIGEASDCFYQEVPFDANSQTPIAAISSVIDTDLGTVPADGSDKIITQGQTIYFNTDRCSDIARNSPPQNDMTNIWRWHQQANDLDDELRTDNVPETAPIGQPFNNVGITNVNLMCIDGTGPTGPLFRSSDMAKQLITVKPSDDHTWLTFWIKDSYTGRELFGNTINSDCLGSPDCQQNIDLITENSFVNTNVTNFEKYAAINGTTIWHEDVAGDDGWEYIAIDLGLNDFNMSGELEIGLRAVNGGADAEQVRGVLIYIDDVYINDLYGNNAIINGDFEQIDPDIILTPEKPVDPTPAAWAMQNETDDPDPDFRDYDVPCQPQPVNPNYTGAYPNLPGTSIPEPFKFPVTVSNTTYGLAGDDPRSGNLAYRGIVKPFTTIYYDPQNDGAATERFIFGYSAGRLYHEGRYKAVTQTFYTNPQSRQAQPVAFNVSPVPARSGSSLTVQVFNGKSDVKYKYLVSDIRGVNVMEGSFTGSTWKINQNLAPGIYYISLYNNNSTSLKKLIVTN